MSDQELRKLERGVRDVLDQARLEREWLRAGRGFSGEELPAGVTATRVRGVYLKSRIELVRVPEGEARCPSCEGAGWLDSRTWPPREPKACATCGARGSVPLGAFWIGRFPVTREEFGRFLDEQGRGWPRGVLRGKRDLRPIAGLMHGEACEVAAAFGFRLPNLIEWKRAALDDMDLALGCRSCAGSGRLVETEAEPEPDFEAWVRPRPRYVRTYVGRFALPQASDGSVQCSTCLGSGRVARKYPWGVDEPDERRCVFDTDRVRPVGARREGVIEPARPLGASPFGALDMFGNVAEDVDGAVVGGSFASKTHLLAAKPMRLRGGVPLEETGFRVVLAP